MLAPYTRETEDEYEPDLGVMVMDLQLALELLRDRQYRVGSDVLARAIAGLYPPLNMRDVGEMIRVIYKDTFASFTQDYPLLDIFTKAK